MMSTISTSGVKGKTCSQAVECSEEQVAEIVVDDLKRLLDFDPEAGVFRWRRTVNSRAKAGSIAGRKNGHGYVEIGIGGRKFAAHRLAFLFSHGRWPAGDLDHINRSKADNRPCNLREATRAGNMANTGLRSNNRSGVKGVCFDKRRGLWRVAVANKFVGHFENKNDAATAYLKAAQAKYGEFARGTRNV